MPMPIMIWLAVIVEAAIGNWLDMIILLLIQFVNASIGWCAPPPTLYSDTTWQHSPAQMLAPLYHDLPMIETRATPTCPLLLLKLLQLGAVKFKKLVSCALYKCHL